MPVAVWLAHKYGNSFPNVRLASIQHASQVILAADNGQDRNKSEQNMFDMWWLYGCMRGRDGVWQLVLERVNPPLKMTASMLQPPGPAHRRAAKRFPVSSACRPKVARRGVKDASEGGSQIVSIDEAALARDFLIRTLCPAVQQGDRLFDAQFGQKLCG